MKDKPALKRMMRHNKTKIKFSLRPPDKKSKSDKPMNLNILENNMIAI